VVKGVPVHARRRSYNSYKKLFYVAASDIKNSLLNEFDSGNVQLRFFNDVSVRMYM
jgi:hypothetical protein